MFAAVMFIPISDAIAISFMNPVIGAVILGRKAHGMRWRAAAMREAAEEIDARAAEVAGDIGGGTQTLPLPAPAPPPGGKDSGASGA